MIDLESAICDVADMANVLEIILTKANAEAAAVAETDISAKYAAAATAYWRDAATFTALHLSGMIVDLRKQYYLVEKK
jgi:hypothetical protein